MGQLVIVRGLPGSGKTTLGKEKLGYHKGYPGPLGPVHGLVEADQFRMVDGEYVYNPKLNRTAHQWALTEALRRLQSMDTVVLCGVYHRVSLMAPIIEAAVKQGHEVRVVESETPWAKDIHECYERGTHNVPLDSIQMFYDQWQDFDNMRLTHMVNAYRVIQDLVDPPVVEPVPEDEFTGV